MKKIAIFIAVAILSPFTFHLSSCAAQDAVCKLMRHEWTLNADGTSDYHYRHEVQILRNRALVAYADKGETFVVYNPDLEDLVVNEVYTIQKDGTRVNMPQNAFVYQLPSSCADCGRFNHLRELAMIHTGMELGCTIVVDYTIYRRYNFLHESIPLQRECPVEKLEVKVQYPSDMDVDFRITGLDYLPSDRLTRTMSATSGENSAPVTLLFELTDMPQAPREPYMPDDIVPTLRLFNGVPEFTPAFNQEGFMGSRDVMGQVMNTTGMKNIVNARNYVVDNIHLNDIRPSHLGYIHATPEEVWQSGCGTAVDKAVLLAAILNAEGYRASVVGDDADQVAVYVDTLEYRLSVRNKAPMTLFGKARDEVRTVSNKGTFEAVLDTLEDGFFSFPIPAYTIQGERDPWVDASQLPMVRTTPLQLVSACDVHNDCTFLLPQGVKMVGKAVKRKLSFDGVGSVEFTVKQSGNKLRIVQKLKIEKSLIPVEDYAKFRQLMAAWHVMDEAVLLRAK